MTYFGELLCAPLRVFAFFAVKEPLKQLTAKSAKNAKKSRKELNQGPNRGRGFNLREHGQIVATAV